MIFAGLVRSQVINLQSTAWNAKKQMFHMTGTAHSKGANYILMLYMNGYALFSQW